MFEFFGFDPKTLSNDELFDKQLVLTSKRLIAIRAGKMDAANQLQAMISAIEFERRERIFNERIGARVLESSPVVIETDIGLQDRSADEEPRKTLAKPEQRLIRRAIRTDKPVTPK